MEQHEIWKEKLFEAVADGGFAAQRLGGSQNGGRDEGCRGGGRHQQRIEKKMDEALDKKLDEAQATMWDANNAYNDDPI